MGRAVNRLFWGFSHNFLASIGFPADAGGGRQDGPHPYTIINRLTNLRRAAGFAAGGTVEWRRARTVASRESFGYVTPSASICGLPEYRKGIFAHATSLPTGSGRQKSTAFGANFGGPCPAPGLGSRFSAYGPPGTTSDDIPILRVYVAPCRLQCVSRGRMLRVEAGGGCPCRRLTRFPTQRFSPESKSNLWV
jgi:hypothetical protein